MKPPSGGRRCATACAGALLAAASVSLQGCDLPRVDGFVDVGDVSIPSHQVPNWRQASDYFAGMAYRDNITNVLSFNSCEAPAGHVASYAVCGGRGHCRAFSRDDLTNPVFFCECERDWAGPECASRRKSQMVAWLLSLFLGPLAADQFYLGWTVVGTVKVLNTVFGLLSWLLFSQEYVMAVVIGSFWLRDVVRTGASPIRANQQFRTADDLPRWMFAVGTVVFFCLIAFSVGVYVINRMVHLRRAKGDALTYYGRIH